MAISLFDKLKTELATANIQSYTQESQKWFLDRTRRIGRINEVSFLKDPNLIRKNRFFPGYMYHFTYDPKGAETLPYYDRFPLILAVQPAPGGFYGLNLHYINPLTRALLLDKLLDIANKEQFDEKKRIRLSYNILSSTRKYKEFEPCFKHYLTDHITSRLMMVPSQEWEVAIFLPTERFENSQKRAVWKDSKKKILGI
jgi:hypothetical protein